MGDTNGWPSDSHTEIDESQGCRTFKLVLIGDSGVGKTCMVERAVRNLFTDNSDATIGAAFQKYQLRVDGNIVTYHIWDTAGQERYRSLGPIYYRGSHAAIVVYDITDSKTYDNIDIWIYNLKRLLGSDVLIALVGNKSDLEHRRNVDYKGAKKFAKKNGLLFTETSAKTASNISALFHTITRELLKTKVEEKTKGFSLSNGLDDGHTKKVKKGKCC